MTLLLLEKLGEVINPSGIIVTDHEAFAKYNVTKIEVPDGITDYLYCKYTRCLYFVIDGNIHTKIIERAKG